MNWLPKDKSTLGIILGLVAILLAIPLNLVANLVTPKIRNWWAERSVTGLKRRIAELQNELTKANQYPFISEGEDFILSIIKGIIFCTGGILISFWGIVISAVVALRGKESIGLILYSVFAFMFIMAFMYFLPRLIDKFLKRRSMHERQSMAENLKKLSAKLESLEKS